MQYIFLSKLFYNDYNCLRYPEIEQKQKRPYVMLLVKIEGLTFAIPFRSKISHNFSFLTNEVNRCGLDYSKAIVLSEDKYIDFSRTPHIRQNEHIALFGKKHLILKEFKKYLKNYKRAVKNNVQDTIFIYRISTLQYFHNELGLS